MERNSTGDGAGVAFSAFWGTARSVRSGVPDGRAVPSTLTLTLTVISPPSSLHSKNPGDPTDIAHAPAGCRFQIKIKRLSLEPPRGARRVKTAALGHGVHRVASHLTTQSAVAPAHHGPATTGDDAKMDIIIALRLFKLFRMVGCMLCILAH